MKAKEIESKKKIFDFDTQVDRRYSDSVKWARFRDRDILPMWVADMDFKSPDEVLKALQARVEHGVFGYATIPEELPGLIVDRILRLYSWRIEPEWLVWLPGLVSGINVACRALGGGDAVMSLVPVYPPFLSAPAQMGKRLVTVPLLDGENGWRIDFDALERAVSSDCRLLLFCHPHNPVGRVWSADELLGVADFCRRHGLAVCSDEIHCELILDTDRRHLPFAPLDEYTLRNTITLMSPSKTFNLAGLGCAFAIIANPGMRMLFRRAMAGLVSEINIMGLTSARAAYMYGDEWLQALITYLAANRGLVEERIAVLPRLGMHHIEATYLAWIDVRRLDLSSPARFFEEKAGVSMSDGADFGAPGFLRLNFGCPSSVLKEALDRIEKAALAVL
jgi:cystathionine beta-lyase